MKGDKKTIIAVILAVVAVSVIAYQFLGTGSANVRAASSAIAAPTPAPVQTAVSQTVASRPKDVRQAQTDYDRLIASVSELDLAYRSETFRNPMAPLVPDPATQAMAEAETVSPDAISRGYSIKGIIWNDAQPLALINDQVVGIGERLDDGALITEINPSSVKFTKRGNRYVLVLREE
jgi:hypothetical protein